MCLGMSLHVLLPPIASPLYPIASLLSRCLFSPNLIPSSRPSCLPIRHLHHSDKRKYPSLQTTQRKRTTDINIHIIGGHLAFRAAFDKRVVATVCYFATDIHSHSLGEGKKDDSLERAGEIKGEVIMASLASSLSPSLSTSSSM